MMIKGYTIAIACIALLIFVRVPNINASRRPQAVLQSVGLSSNALECLAVGEQGEDQFAASGLVDLAWQGQAERARLILTVSGSDAAHTIKVNGSPVAQAPISPMGDRCSGGASFYIEIDPNVVVQGNNLIEITNDAMPDDDWSAAYVRLEVLGDIAVPDSSDLINTFDDIESYSQPTLSFTSSYDGSTQEFKAQIPVSDINDCDTITATPLMIYVHGRTSSMQEPFDNGFATAAQNKGWLLAAPDLHGSWPFNLGRKGKYAYASIESQHDIIDTIDYMVEHCNVKTNQIYLFGSSMGGQTGLVTVAKYPHIFAATFDNKGPTDMYVWYDEQYEHEKMEQECHINETPKTPPQNPFCYQRRSGLNFATNFIHMPISMTHSVADNLVPIHHSQDLRDAINSYGPDQTASLYEDTVVGPTCGNPYHCYLPDPVDVMDFFESFTLNNNYTHIHIKSDESKPYYWLNITQSGSDHWTEIDASYNPANNTVTAVISDTQALTLGFYFDSTTPLTNEINLPLPAMGLPSNITYQVTEEGDNVYNYQQSYTSGYFTVALQNTGQFTVTISPFSSSPGGNSVYLPIIIK